MTTATRKQLITRVEELGCDVEIISRGPERTVEVLCPTGKRIAGVDLHMVLQGDYRDSSIKMGQLYGAMLEDLADGLEDCTDPECDYCTDE